MLTCLAKEERTRPASRSLVKGICSCALLKASELERVVGDPSVCAGPSLAASGTPGCWRLEAGTEHGQDLSSGSLMIIHLVGNKNYSSVALEKLNIVGEVRHCQPIMLETP